MTKPRCILLISGKRKCGKDFISEKLKLKLTEQECCIVRISEPIKSYYADTNNLDLDALMSDGPYKELHRMEMIKWSDGVRILNPGHFCAAACAKAPTKMVWIVSDIRRKTDINWFQNMYGDQVRTVRINADDSVRKSRGWVFTPGVDNVTSECDLDDYDSWDLIINNNNEASVQDEMEKLLNVIYSF